MMLFQFPFFSGEEEIRRWEITLIIYNATTQSMLTFQNFDKFIELNFSSA